LRVAHTGRLRCTEDPSVEGIRPAVSCLFRSVAEVYGPRAIGIILSGMGKDGAAELRLMRDRGAVTFAQDRETSIVHGMPGAAENLGAAVHVLPPERIAATLCEMLTPGDECSSHP